MPAHTTSNNAPEINQARAASVHHCTARWNGADRELACSRIPTDAPIPPFSRRQKPQTPDFLQENQGFVFTYCAVEGEIRYRPPPLFQITPPPGFKGYSRYGAGNI